MADDRTLHASHHRGHTAGKPFDPVDQLGIVRAALEGMETMTRVEEIRHLPNQWDTPGRWRADAMRADGGDTRQPRDETPQFQHPADREAARALGDGAPVSTASIQRPPR